MKNREMHDVLAFVMAQLRTEIESADKQESRTAWLNNSLLHLIEARHALDRAGAQTWAREN